MYITFCIYRYRKARGYFRVSSYFFAKVFCDLLPMSVLPVLLFSVISYWMLGGCCFVMCTYADTMEGEKIVSIYSNYFGPKHR